MTKISEAVSNKSDVSSSDTKKNRLPLLILFVVSFPIIFLLLYICDVRTSSAREYFVVNSAVFDTGKNVYPINNDNIRMVSEKVAIHRRNDPIRGRIANVDCEFAFENITDEEQTVKVGFPGLTCKTTNPFCTPGLNKFVSYIDGKEVPVDIKEEIISTYTYDEIDQKGRRVKAEGYTKRNWYTWDVTFPPKSTIYLRNSYETFVSGESDGHHALVYILKTGANWSGTIGSATIEVIYDDEDFMKRRISDIRPGGYKIFENKIVWELQDFIPEENIIIDEISDVLILKHYCVNFVNYFNSKKYEGAERLYTLEDMVNPITEEGVMTTSIYPLLSRDVLSEHLERLFVMVLRNEIFARHGRKDIEWHARFLFDNGFIDVSWYEDNLNYSDDMLNDIEKQNIKFIGDYEKEKGWR